MENNKIEFIIGVSGFLLPAVLLASTYFGVCSYYSLSHFYFHPFLGGVFVAWMASIGTLFLVYNPGSPLHWVATKLVALAAIGIAIFPTVDDGCAEGDYSSRIFVYLNYHVPTDTGALVSNKYSLDLFEMSGFSNSFHIGGVVIFFVVLVYYQLAVFWREEKKSASPNRQAARIYVGTALVIVLCILAIPVGPRWFFDRNVWIDSDVVLWLESIAIWALGIAWMTRGFTNTR